MRERGLMHSFTRHTRAGTVADQRQDSQAPRGPSPSGWIRSGDGQKPASSHLGLRCQLCLQSLRLPVILMLFDFYNMVK